MAEGHRQITIRKIKESDIVGAPDKALTDDDIDPVQCSTCDPKIRLLHGRVLHQPDDWSDGEFE